MANNVFVIPATKKTGSRTNKDDNKKTRVCAYCRVSTDSEEQGESYEAQLDYYDRYIKENPSWEFVGIYADEGISATNTKKREDFNRMIQDCKAGKIDMVLTKSISRFARNTVDCLNFCRELKKNNIAVVFQKENINTLDTTGETLLTIMASMAQSESESISQNVKLGLKFRYEEGKVNVNYNKFLGYTKGDDGKLIIVPEEAEVVKRIYREFLEGKGIKEIKDGLESDGVKNGANNNKWWESNIIQILKNEKYIGDALLQKTITIDVLDKVRIKNDGTQPQYYVEGSQEPIISRELFALVQEEFRRRSNLISELDGKKKRIFSTKYALSSICRCSKCGDMLRRTNWNNRGLKYTVWRCVTRVEDGPKACDAPTIKEDTLQAAIISAFNELLELDEGTREKMLESVKGAIELSQGDEIESIVKQYNQKQLELVELAKKKLDYTEVKKEIEELKKKKDELFLQNAEGKSLEKRIKEIKAFMKEAPDKLESFDEDLIRKYIDKVIVHPEKVTVLFKAGLETDIAIATV